MKENPLVTIIVPNYNYGRFLDQCLKSAVEQNYENLQVIFTDNCSTDESYEIALSYRHNYKDRILVYRNDENIGGSRNSLKACRLMNPNTKYYVYLSSDDVFQTSFVSRSMEIMSNFPQVSFVLVHRDLIDDNNNIQSEPPFYNANCVIPSVKQMEVFMMAGIGVSTQCFRNRLAETIGHDFSYHFDIAGDWYSNFCIATAGDVGYIKDPLCLYRIDPSNVTSNAVKDMTNTFEHFMLVNAFREISDRLGHPSVSARLPAAIEKLGSMCLRYSKNLLREGDSFNAKRYLFLAPVLKPDITFNSTWKRLFDCLKLEQNLRLQILDEIESDSPLKRLTSYDPPEGAVLLE